MENPAAISRPTSPSWYALVAAILYLGWHLLYRLAATGTALSPFDGPFNNGPFQLHNPLIRMDLGQTVGAGFSFFHGPAIPALHYPIHWLAGRGLHASELARHLVSVAAFHVGWLAFFWAWTGKFRLAVVPWALAVMASDAWDLWQLASCDNSLYGLRGVGPLLAAACAVAPWRLAVRAALAGMFLGWSLLLGTELGLTATVAAAAGLGACLFRQTLRGGALRAVAWGLPALLGGLLLPLLLLGGPAAVDDFCRFNLAIVPADQFWYFGVPPNPFVKNFGELLGIEYVRTTLLVALVALAGLAIWLAGSANPARPLVLGALLLHGALATAALMGVLNFIYIGTVRREIIIVVVTAFWQAATRLGQQDYRWIPRLDGVTAALLLASLVLWPTHHRYEGIIKLPQVAGGLADLAGALGRLPGGTLSPRLEDDLDQVLAAVEQVLPDPATRPGQLWSAFASLPEDRLGITHPVCDYIIHALGPRRAEYVARFREIQPALVLVPRQSRFSHEEWLRDSHWSFYELLYLNYTTRLATSGHLLLEKRPGWREPGDWQGTALPNEKGAISLPPAQPGKRLSVEVDYTTHSRWGWLPMVGKLPRWLVFRGGGDEAVPVSLPPGETTWRFSSRAKPGEVVTLNPLAASPWGGKLSLSQARWRWVDAAGLTD